MLTPQVMVPIGVINSNSASGMKPATDFEDLGQSCQITEINFVTSSDKVTRSSDKSSNSYWVCYVNYYYGFVISGEPATYTSVADKVRRDGQFGSACAQESGAYTGSSVYETVPSLSLDQTVQCWRPAVSEVPSGYQCGNGACVKIFSPYDEAAAKAKDAEVLVIVGSVLLGVGVLGLVVLAIALVCFCKNRNRPMDTQGAGTYQYANTYAASMKQQYN